jgi:hypothetical protein
MSGKSKAARNIELEEMLSHLSLETVDATQTAFANSGIHISETTAFRWRELAKDNAGSKLSELLQEDETDTGRNPVSSDTQVETGCFKRITAKLRNLLCGCK